MARYLSLLLQPRLHLMLRCAICGGDAGDIHGEGHAPDCPYSIQGQLNMAFELASYGFNVEFGVNGISIAGEYIDPKNAYKALKVLRTQRNKGENK